jgi:RHS repeat-associated protein
LHEQFGYGYDKAGNLNERTNNALIQSFAVNDRNELSSASQSGTLTVAGTATVPSGNAPYYNDPGVTSVTVNGQSADIYEDGSFAADGFTPVTGQNTYTAIAQDNLYPPRMSTNSVTVNVAGGNSYTYDSNGNLISDGTRSFAYDDENQLVAVWVSNSWSNSFAYDGLLRKRIEQQYTYRSSSRSYLLTNEIHYIYDGNVVVEERDKNNEPLTTYTRGLDLSGTLQGAGGIGGLLARSDNQKIIPAILSPEYPNPQNVVTSFYFNDAQGNVIALVSPGDILLAQYKYDPFGNLISKSGPMADINKYRFSSKEWEENAGLYYYLYRFYDPNLQRWLNRDPIQEGGGINLFNFADNAPLGYIDILGLQGTNLNPIAPFLPYNPITPPSPTTPILVPPRDPTWPPPTNQPPQNPNPTSIPPQSYTNTINLEPYTYSGNGRAANNFLDCPFGKDGMHTQGRWGKKDHSLPVRIIFNSPTNGTTP